MGVGLDLDSHLTQKRRWSIAGLPQYVLSLATSVGLDRLAAASLACSVRAGPSECVAALP